MTTDIDLELIRDTAWEASGPDPAVRQRARDAVLYAAAPHQQSGVERDRRRAVPRAWRVVVWAGLAGTLALGVAAVGALLPGRGARESSLGASMASAAVVLDRVAVTALHGSAVLPTARQYEYLEVQEGSISSVGQGQVGMRFWQSDLRQDWSRAHQPGRERISNSRQGWLAPLDRSIARSHGLSLAQFMPDQNRDSINPASMPSPWGVYSVAGLPTEPAALLKAIRHELATASPPPPPGAGPRPAITTADVFNVISNRLLFASDAPSLRAALYRVIAHLPGVQLLGHETDRIGRHGIAITLSHTEIGDEATRTVLLFDPATSDVLQTQLIQVAPLNSYPAPTIPAGTVLNYTVFITRGIVNTMDELPDGARLPMHLATPHR